MIIKDVSLGRCTYVAAICARWQNPALDLDFVSTTTGVNLI